MSIATSNSCSCEKKLLLTSVGILVLFCRASSLLVFAGRSFFFSGAWRVLGAFRVSGLS